MTEIKDKDFIEIEYTGKCEDIVFDTTNEEKAKEQDIHNENTAYGPVVICVGQGQVLKGLDKNLPGKETEKEYTIDIPAEDGFGKKDASLLKLIPKKAFDQQQIRPMPGLEVNFDGYRGVVRTVTGGRVIVDFNHPLSSKELSYDIKINRVVTDKKEQINSIIELMFHVGKDKVQTEIDENNKATIAVDKAGQLNEQSLEKLKNKILDLIDLKDVEINVKKPDQ